MISGLDQNGKSKKLQIQLGTIILTKQKKKKKKEEQNKLLFYDHI